MKPILQRLPELFFIGLGIYWFTENYLASGYLNWIAIVFIVVLIVQLVFQNRIAGIATGVVLGLISAYMMFAVIDEFYDFKTVNDEALKLLAYGLGMFGTGLLSATAMVYKFAVSQHDFMKSRPAVTA